MQTLEAPGKGGDCGSDAECSQSPRTRMGNRDHCRNWSHTGMVQDADRPDGACGAVVLGCRLADIAILMCRHLQSKIPGSSGSSFDLLFGSFVSTLVTLLVTVPIARCRERCVHDGIVKPLRAKQTVLGDFGVDHLTKSLFVCRARRTPGLICTSSGIPLILALAMLYSRIWQILQSSVCC